LKTNGKHRRTPHPMPAHSGNAVCPIVGNGCILLLITRRAWLSLRQRNLMHAHVRGQGTTKGKEHSHQEAAWILAKKMVLRGWAVGGGAGCSIYVFRSRKAVQHGGVVVGCHTTAPHHARHGMGACLVCPVACNLCGVHGKHGRQGGAFSHSAGTACAPCQLSRCLSREHP